MPTIFKTSCLPLFLSGLVLSCLILPVHAGDFQNLTPYYIRLDHHFRTHRSVKDRVTMMPAENEFRAQGFSPVFLEGLVRADRQSARTTVAAMVRKETFARVLEAQGLKSIHTLDQDTITSYEGVILSPADITISTFDPDLGGYPYTARVRFSPLAFPDQWDTLKRQYNVKQVLNDFFLLFK